MEKKDNAALSANDTQAAAVLEKPESQLLEMWRTLLENKAAVLGLVIIVFLIFIAVFGRFLMPYEPNAADMTNTFAKPSAEHWFGALAGYYGGKIDTIIMRIMDIMLSIPSILLAITFMAALGKGIDKAIIAIGLVSIPEYARIVRGSILSIKENDYVQAAKVIGNKDSVIIFKHILPNVLSSLIVRATLGISMAVLDTAALGFLGLGVQPPYAEWGDMLGRSRGFIFSAPHTLIFPGLAITITVLAFNLLGDGLRDAIDPKSRK